MKPNKTNFLSPDTILSYREMSYEQKGLLSPDSSLSFEVDEDSYSYVKQERNKSIQKKSFSRMYKPILLLLFISISLFTIFSVVQKINANVDKNVTTSEWQTIKAEYSDLPLQYNGTYTTNPVNSTLGFEKILVLNLPHRRDKKHEITLMASAHDIDLTFFNAPLVGDLKASGLPWPNFQKLSKGEVAIYQAHLDMLQHVIEQGWSTALILEDDSDWDVDMKYALQRLHQPLATLINSYKPHNDTVNNKNSTQHDPWLSTEWDYINIGTCHEEEFQPGNREKEGLDLSKPPFVKYEDRTLPYKENIISGGTMRFVNHYKISLPSKDDFLPNKTHHRVVSIGSFPTCTNAYAVSRQGAIRLLYHLTRYMDEPIDVKMAWLGRGSYVRSISIVPPIFAQWKTKDAGLLNSDKHLETDSQKQQDTSHLNHNPSIGSSEFLRNSLRASLKEKHDALPHNWGYIDHYPKFNLSKAHTNL